MRRERYQYFCLCVLLLLQSAVGSTGTNGTPLILRVRQADGTLQKLAIPTNQDGRASPTLRDILEQHPNLLPPGSKKKKEKCKDSWSIQSSAGSTLDPSQTLQQLGLKHGSLITVLSTKSKKSKGESSILSSKRQQSASPSFNPFPELAKSDKYRRLQQKYRQRQNKASFAALADLSAALHVVEPQPTSVVQRLYMCSVSAERFFQASEEPTLLLGNWVRERKHGTFKAQTSLSSTTEADEFCVAAKVHALYPLSSDFAGSKAARVAEWLGLNVIGWIFSYSDDRHQDDGLPVHVPEILEGARLQMDEMKQQTKDFEYRGAFCTAAMNAQTGATEAFQLSDVAVQMVAEGMFDTTSETKKTSRGRHAQMRQVISVDGQETTNLDTVLCLVNTALLSHTGWFAGTAASTSKKTGRMTKKARKALREACETSSAQALLPLLCNFSTIVALYEQGLTEVDCKELCRIVRKWARGQKMGIELDDGLVQRILSLISTP